LQFFIFLYTLHSTLLYKGFDMSSPLFYIFAPFILAFGLFALYLIVSLFLKDPARPFRMFKAPPLRRGARYSVHPSTSSGQGSAEDEDEQADDEE
jgi:hypothetical protein